MKILITGGYGFIGSHTAERFNREGHEVFIIDNLSRGKKDNLKIKHKFYKFDITDENCEEIFASNKFDIVINLAAQIDASESLNNPYIDTKSNVLGLVNMLHLSKKYGVKKFIFTSSAAVYGDNNKLPLSEEDSVNPISPYGLNKLTGEKYCKLWSEIYNLDTVCLRLSNVYGPRQSSSGEGGVVSIFMNKILKKEKLLVYGDGFQTRDFVYVEDVADALYKSVEYTRSGVINIATNKQISINDLINTIRNECSFFDVEHVKERKGDIVHSRLSNERAINELNWIPINSLETGISKTFRWYEEFYYKTNKNKELDGSSNENGHVGRKNKRIGLVKKALPFIENILAFLFVFLISEYSKEQGIELFIDIKLIYIIIIGIIYGLKQVSISIILACILFIWDIGNAAQNIISLVYNVNTLLHFSLYIFIGSILGYVVDSKKVELDTKEYEFKELKSKFDFLYEMYEESKQVRMELQDQILSTEDSFGKIYKVTSTLDSLEPEKVFSEAVGVIENTLKCKDVYIFSVDKSQRYLRLISSSKDSCLNISKSIEVNDREEIHKLVFEKEIFANKNLDKSLPMMMAPIILDNVVVSVIFIYSMEFESLSLYKQNLFKVVSNLITSSLANAIQYNEAISKEKYIDGTLVLKSKYFSNIIRSKIEAKNKNNTEFTLLKVKENNWLDKDISYKIEKGIRELDYIGVNENNELFISLSNTKQEESEYVIERLERMNIFTEIIKEDEYYENSNFNSYIG